MGEEDREETQIESETALPQMYVEESADEDVSDAETQENHEDTTDQPDDDATDVTDEVEGDEPDTDEEPEAPEVKDKTKKVDSTPDKKLERLGYDLANMRRENKELQESLAEIRASLKVGKPAEVKDEAPEDDSFDKLDDDDVLTKRDALALQAKQAKQKQLSQEDVNAEVRKQLAEDKRQQAERQTWIDSFPETHKELHALGVKGDEFLKRYQEEVSVLDGVSLPADELNARASRIYKSVLKQVSLEASAAKSVKATPPTPRKSTRGTGVTTKGAASVNPSSIKRDSDGLPMMMTVDD